MDTYRTTPPANAVVLFNGTDLRNWMLRSGQPAKWKVEAGFLEVAPGAGDIMTRERFLDFVLHAEFRCPDLAKVPRGQTKGNSGLFLQGRYELQVLDSYGVKTPGKGDCGAFYDLVAPLTNASKPPLAWQTFDVFFRSARSSQGNVTEWARATVMQNGQVIHNNIELRNVTEGALDEDVGEPGPLLLQDHGDVIAYRKIWLVPLPMQGSDQFEGR